MFSLPWSIVKAIVDRLAELRFLKAIQAILKWLWEHIGGGTTGFDPSLPWGGVGIGAPCLFGQPGNQRTTSFTVVQMRAEHSGSIDRVAWYNKFNLSTDGYHTGNGGQIKWVLHEITSKRGALPIVLGPVLAETAVITNPVLPTSWNDAFTAVGGTGKLSDDRFHEFPTLYFKNSVPVDAGDLLAFVHTQLDSSSGTVSINDCYSTKRKESDWSPFEHARSSRVFALNSKNKLRFEHFPELLYGYTDGFVCGAPHIGYASGDVSFEDEHIVLGGSAGTRARQVIPMPSWANGKKISRVHTFYTRYDKTTSADIRCSIRLAGGSPGGSADNGMELAGATLSAGPIRYETDIKGTKENPDPIPSLVFDFTKTPITVSGGSTYYIELSTTGGPGTTRYIGERLQRYLEVSSFGLRRPTGFPPGFRAQRNTGLGWKSLATAGTEHDLGVWVEFA